MKIGLEFEGVIHDFQNGEIVRWSKIDKTKQHRIKRILYANREAVSPCDRYDALAEVRTLPIDNPTPEKLITALFSEMELASHAFSANGYDIHWFEEPIPVELHDEITKEFATGDPEGKKNKFTWVVDQHGTYKQFQGTGNLFRGGGIHINISSIPEMFAHSLVRNIDNHLNFHKEKTFKSHYRINILYRTRYGFNYEPVLEYMAHGFNVKTLANWRQDLASYSKYTHSEKIYGYEPVPSNENARGRRIERNLNFSWAWALFDSLEYFNSQVKLIK